MVTATATAVLGPTVAPPDTGMSSGPPERPAEPLMPTGPIDPWTVICVDQPGDRHPCPTVPPPPIAAPTPPPRPKQTTTAVRDGLQLSVHRDAEPDMAPPIPAEPLTPAQTITLPLGSVKCVGLLLTYSYRFIPSTYSNGSLCRNLPFPSSDRQ